MNCTVAVGKCALGEITMYEREKNHYIYHETVDCNKF